MSKDKPKKLNFKAVGTVAADYLIIAAGAIVYAMSVVMFTSPNNIAPGGMTGIATMLNYMFSLPIGLFIFLMNIPLFVWGAVENGISFLTKTIIGTAFVSIAIDVLTPFLPAYSGDLIIVSIFGGILNGIGLGFIFYRGGSTGGTDIIALNIHKHFPYISTGNIILIADIATLIMAFFVYNSIESVLYAVITIFVSIKVIDSISYGTSRDNGKLMFIITNHYDDVSDSIMNNLERGVTLLDGEGAYSGEKKKVVMCAVRPQQVFKITSSVKKIDPNAFVIVTTAGTIRGKGFLKKNSLVTAR
ncbi:MAG: YitT family protein [Clostridiales bacterium]|nr:YitT family protein [Clostridiales bacterium]